MNQKDQRWKRRKDEGNEGKKVAEGKRKQKRQKWKEGMKTLIRIQKKDEGKKNNSKRRNKGK